MTTKKVKRPTKKAKATPKANVKKVQPEMVRLPCIGATLVANLQSLDGHAVKALLSEEAKQFPPVGYGVDAIDEKAMTIRISNQRLGIVKEGKFILIRLPHNHMTGIIFTKDLETSAFPVVYTDTDSHIEIINNWLAFSRRHNKTNNHE
ncbi:MAG TPA: hypothetical protein VNY36_03005 [Bacteroidia bacterium]|jgi:hypothetical protein|nr:hypothetical protein [Bacteroidia bacterium]